MVRRIYRLTKAPISTLWRSIVFAAVVAKLLVPVGYMPAALAEGGPIKLCDSYLPTPFPAMPAVDANAADSNHAAHPSAPGDSDMEHAGHAGGGEHGHKHSWERCSLGGLASLAVLAPSDWQLALLAVEADRVQEAATDAPVARIVVAFRSRGPPLAHS